jgi:hypothetical protein
VSASIGTSIDVPETATSLLMDNCQVVASRNLQSIPAGIPEDTTSAVMKKSATDPDVLISERARRLAEHQLQAVTPERLSQTVSEYIQLRAFAFWVRLLVEHSRRVPDNVSIELNQRCRGFLEFAAEYRRAHPQEPEFLWLRLISWIDEHVFGFTTREGWAHALGYYAARDPRSDRVRAYWARCDEEWKQKIPNTIPGFEEWLGAALAEPGQAS